MTYDLNYAQSGYDYFVLPDLPQPSAANASGAFHTIDGIIGSISHPPPPPYPQPHMSYGQCHEVTNSTYTYPPPTPSHGNTYQATRTSYTYPHLHQSMPGPTIASPGYLNVAANFLYPYAPPTAPAPPALAPQPPMSPPPLPQ